jgi:uncharacterized protein YkwD
LPAKKKPGTVRAWALLILAATLFSSGFLLAGRGDPVAVPARGVLRPVPPSPYGPASPQPTPEPEPEPEPKPSPTPQPTPAVAQQLLDAHNRERAARGLPALAISPKLQQAAQAHADFMAKAGRMAHQGIGDGSPWDRIQAAGYRYSTAGENIAWNYQGVAAVMAGWMGDAPHRANVLGNFREAGLAVSYGAKGDPYWCADFGTAAATTTTRTGR